MSNYNYDVPTSGGTIEIANFSADCITDYTVDTSSDTGGMVQSYSASSSAFTVNVSSYYGTRQCTLPVSYKASNVLCTGNTITLIQNGGGGAFNLSVKGEYTNSGTLYVTGLTIRYKVNGAGVVKTYTFLMEDDCVEIPQGHTKTFGTFEFPTTSIGANDTMTITYITLQASNNDCDEAKTCEYNVNSVNISPNSNISSNTNVSLTLNAIPLCQ